MAFPSRRQRLALLAIGNYYLLTNQLTRTRLTELVGFDLADPEVSKSARKWVDNFFQQAAEGGSDKIYEFLRGRVANNGYYETAPQHIKAAIEEAYNFRTEIDHSPAAASLGEIISSLTDKTRLNSVSEVYSGIWDVVRYAGRIGEEPFVVRAAMEIFPRDDSGTDGFPKFLVYYKPGSLMATLDHFEVEGAIIPLAGGQHMYFLGRETDSDYPLDIVAHQVRRPRPQTPPLQLFLGIVRRRQEQGQVLAARVVFLRSRCTNIEELSSKIGTLTEAEFVNKYREEWPNIDEILRLAINKPPRDGKGCLLL